MKRFKGFKVSKHSILWVVRCFFVSVFFGGDTPKP